MTIVIAENDVSQWHDATGVVYHYPSRYRNLLRPGTKLLYYKGKALSGFNNSVRLTKEPHYFGMAIAGNSYPDNESTKGDFFLEITDFIPFEQPILFKEGEAYLEINSAELPRKNYWRDGVRVITAENFARICDRAVLGHPASSDPTSDQTNDNSQSLESRLEGREKQVYTTVYERDSRLRRAAIAIHGTKCKVCGFDFSATYGVLGRGYIHIHHVKPISEAGGQIEVNPATDLMPVCANCHAIIHRKRDCTIPPVELGEIIHNQQRSGSNNCLNETEKKQIQGSFEQIFSVVNDWGLPARGNSTIDQLLKEIASAQTTIGQLDHFYAKTEQFARIVQLLGETHQSICCFKALSNTQSTLVLAAIVALAKLGVALGTDGNALDSMLDLSSVVITACLLSGSENEEDRSGE